jgi:hypothetical protein
MQERKREKHAFTCSVHSGKPCKGYMRDLPKAPSYSHPQIVSSLHIHLQPVKAYSIICNCGFSERMYQVAITRRARYEKFLLFTHAILRQQMSSVDACLLSCGAQRAFGDRTERWSHASYICLCAVSVPGKEALFCLRSCNMLHV